MAERTPKIHTEAKPATTPPPGGCVPETLCALKGCQRYCKYPRGAA